MPNVYVMLQGDTELTAMFKRAVTEAPKAMSRAVKRGATIYERGLRKWALGGGVLDRDTGTLARSVGQKVTKRGLTIAVGSSAKYITTHEGTAQGRSGKFTIIKPKKRKFLTIPLGKNKKERRNRGVAADYKGQSHIERIHDDDGGRTGLYIVRDEPRELLFALARSVSVPVTRPIHSTYEKYRKEAIKDMTETLRKELDRAMARREQKAARAAERAAEAAAKAAAKAAGGQ